MLHFWNELAWITSNLLIGYIAVALIIFAVGYYVLFDPKATTAGKLVFRFALSLVGVIGLICIGIFVDPSAGSAWFEFPGDIIWWRPTLRLAVYAYVAYTITSLAVLLGIRKWRPDWVTTSANRNLVVPRHTRDIDTVSQEKEK
jgi:hypothetical protein